MAPGGDESELARLNAAALIEGETGKPLVVRALHYLGSRRSFPLIPIDYGAQPNTLFGRAFMDAHDML